MSPDKDYLKNLLNLDKEICERWHFINQGLMDRNAENNDYQQKVKKLQNSGDLSNDSKEELSDCYRQIMKIDRIIDALNVQLEGTKEEIKQLLKSKGLNAVCSCQENGREVRYIFFLDKNGEVDFFMEPVLFNERKSSC